MRGRCRTARSGDGSGAPSVVRVKASASSGKRWTRDLLAYGVAGSGVRGVPAAAVDPMGTREPDGPVPGSRTVVPGPPGVGTRARVATRWLAGGARPDPSAGPPKLSTG